MHTYNLINVLQQFISHFYSTEDLTDMEASEEEPGSEDERFDAHGK